MYQDDLDKSRPIISIENLNLYYGTFHALKGVGMQILQKRVTAMIGPSGCGKSTLLRSINRMNDLIENVRIDGQIMIQGEPVYGRDIDLIQLRKKVGMVFQRPNPFPLSIFDNVAFGLRLHSSMNREEIKERVRTSLESVGLWKTLKNHLQVSAMALSGEQQQRLCIARVIAVSPEIILMDEPCSALDPVATQHIEELILTLKENYTIVIVTHNMSQAARISDSTAYFYLGSLIEFGPTKRIFTSPEKKETEDYLTGRFG